MIHLVRLLLFILLSSVAYAQDNGVIEVEITGIESAEGQMLIGLYSTADSWLKAPFKGVFGQIEDGKSKVRFADIPEGTYAISVFHDADYDGELDTFLGIPTEATGSSNNAPAKFGPPKWEDAKFTVKNTLVKQHIRL